MIADVAKLLAALRVYGDGTLVVRIARLADERQRIARPAMRNDLLPLAAVGVAKRHPMRPRMHCSQLRIANDRGHAFLPERRSAVNYRSHRQKGRDSMA